MFTDIRVDALGTWGESQVERWFALEMWKDHIKKALGDTDGFTHPVGSITVGNFDQGSVFDLWECLGAIRELAPQDKPYNPELTVRFVQCVQRKPPWKEGTIQFFGLFDLFPSSHKSTRDQIEEWGGPHGWTCWRLEGKAGGPVEVVGGGDSFRHLADVTLRRSEFVVEGEDWEWIDL